MALATAIMAYAVMAFATVNEATKTALKYSF